MATLVSVDWKILDEITLFFIPVFAEELGSLPYVSQQARS